MDKKSLLIVFAAVIILFAVCIGPAAAYANYEYIWTSSGNQFVQEYNPISGLPKNVYHSEGYYRYDATSKNYFALITPFVNSINKNGVHPKVRYLWFALNMPSGVSADSIQVYNGPTQVYSHSLTWAGTGAYKEYLVDMGSYKDMNRGISTSLVTYNSQNTDQTIYTYGAGAREEW
jgi:hypothetical protein